MSVYFSQNQLLRKRIYRDWCLAIVEPLKQVEKNRADASPERENNSFAVLDSLKLVGDGISRPFH